MYQNMVELLSPAEKGQFKLDHFEITESTFRAILMGITPGKYVRLRCGGEVVMSDTPMERRTNSEFVMNAHGDVLVGGLGIGLVLMAIQDKENVNNITVIEKNQEVIDIVASQLPLNKKVTIVCGDVFKWKPDR